jgi:SAM-dependent methyltransferase
VIPGERPPTNSGRAYQASTYGDRIADIYDDWPRLPQNTERAVEALASLAGDGPILELGIGTGRLALPLVRRGCRVQGIDSSRAMLDKLRAKPDGARIPVTLGDFADMAIEGRFALIFVAFNTFFALRSQEDQLRCFTGVAQHLTDEGVFVIEAFVPDLGRFDRGQRVAAFEIGTDALYLEASVHDPVGQRVRTQQVMIGERGIRLYPVEIRYAWPSELDLMARLAGLRLRERWAGWERQPFDASTFTHVSVYEQARPI